jgi:hypothetical protein
MRFPPSRTEGGSSNMPSLRQYARLIEDCERRALQPGPDGDAPVPLFQPEGEGEARSPGAREASRTGG